MDTKTDPHILKLIQATQVEAPLAPIVRKSLKEEIVVKVKPVPPPVVKRKRGRPRKVRVEVDDPPPKIRSTMAEEIDELRLLEVRVVEKKLKLVDRQLDILDKINLLITGERKGPKRIVLSQQQIARVRR